MSFDTYGANQKDDSKKTEVNFDELNQYVVDTAQLQNREVLVGYVSMLVDLGMQDQPDAEVVFTGTEDEEKQAIAEKPATYFKDGYDQQTKKKVRLKCWPQKPVQCVAVAVDFSDIIIDKGAFFGESKPLPLRLWLGGQFYIPEAGMVVGRPTPLKVKKDEQGDWTLDAKHLFYKMAVGAKLINAGEPFQPKDIDKLLGKGFQFEAQVFFKESKGKKYYTEYLKFTSGLGRGQKEPELLTTPMMIQFKKESPEDAIKELRAHVVNTIKRASNYEGSVIQGQIESLRGGSKPTSQDDSPAPSTKAKGATKPSENEAEEDSDGGIDFDIGEDVPF